jgi:hypothetical protein
MAPILYSTNPYIKLMIQERYESDLHYVWCSEAFDSSKKAAYGLAAVQAPSSDPFTIYKQLQSDVKRSDKHSAKIAAQKLSFAKLAAEWSTSGKITSEEAEEIAYMTDSADFSWWRPLLYVIASDRVKDRIQTVPIAKRASLGMEYIIPDLKRDEFDIVEI